MAELNTVTRTKIAQVAGNKASGGSFNRSRVAIIDTPAVYAAPANGDTAGTELYLPQGARLQTPVSLSCAAGNASSTVSVGIRSARTKVAIDPTAVLNAAPINAAFAGQLNSGSKVTNGQFYVMPEDVELYLTYGGAAGLANQALRIEVSFVAP